MEDYNQLNRIEHKIDEQQKLLVFAIDGIKILMQLSSQQIEIDFIEREIQDPKGKLHTINNEQVEKFKKELEKEQEQEENHKSKITTEDKNDDSFYQP